MKHTHIILLLALAVIGMLMLGQSLMSLFDSKQFIQNHLDLNTRMALLRAGINV